MRELHDDPALFRSSRASLRRLRRLVTVHGPAGYEAPAATLWRSVAKGFSDVATDSHGNSTATIAGTAHGPTILLTAHIDAKGPVVRADGRAVTQSLDNRVGAHIILETLRRYKARRGAATVIGAATVHARGIDVASGVTRGITHGLGYGGAAACAAAIQPDLAIVVDVLPASDQPLVDTKRGRTHELKAHELGNGPLIGCGAGLSPVVMQWLLDIAYECCIPTPQIAFGKRTHTDADIISTTGWGVPTALLAIPGRDLYTSRESVSLRDVDYAIALLVEVCRHVTTRLNLRSS